MQSRTPFILFLFLFHVSSSRQVDFGNTTELETTGGKIKSDISTLEDALATLNELTTIQKQVWEQQESHRDEMQATFAEFSERELERSRALEAEQILLKEIRGKISRKLKVLAKNGNSDQSSGQCNYNDKSTTDIPPKDCSSIYLEGEDTSGLYKVWPTWNQNRDSFPVYCDMNTDGGGWTVIYRRENSEISEDYFARNWAEYSNGFGDLEASFWIGNRRMYQLTKQDSYELRFDFLNSEDEKTWSVYRRFRVAEADQNYVVYIDAYEPSGTASDIFTSSRGAKFSTYDRINLERKTVEKRDRYGRVEYEYITHRNCAEQMKIGWWYPTNCIFHPMLHLNQTSPFKTEMKIRPVLFSQKNVA